MPGPDKKYLAAEAVQACDLWTRIFIRSKTGGQRLSLVKIYFGVGGMWLLNAIFNFHTTVPLLGSLGAKTHNDSTRYYAIAFLICALWQRHERRREFKAGSDWHGEHRGISHFEALARFMPREWIYRHLDPVVAFAGGYAVSHYLDLNGLGVCLMLSAACLWITEALECEALDRQAWIIRNLGPDAEGLTGRGRAASNTSRRQTSGLYTGLGDGNSTEYDDKPEHAPQADNNAKIRFALVVIAIGALVFYGPKLRSTAAKASSPNSSGPRGRLPFLEARQDTTEPAATDAAILNGIWGAHSTSNRGSCLVSAELQPGEKDALSVVAKMECATPYLRRKELALKPVGWQRCYQPIQAELTGKTGTGAMTLQPVRTTALKGDAYSITSATLTPLKGKLLLFEFTEDNGCAPGKFVLRRSPWNRRR